MTTDKCFVCLEKCKIRICSTCSCRSHKKCIDKYIKTLDRTQIPKCPVCKNDLENYRRPLTRASTEKARWNDFKETIRALLWQIDRISGDKQKDLAKILFDCAYENRYLIRKISKELLDTIIFRLNYLYEYNKWEYAKHLMYKFRHEF